MPLTPQMFVGSDLWFRCQPLPQCPGQVMLGWLAAPGALTAVTAVSALHDWAHSYV